MRLTVAVIVLAVASSGILFAQPLTCPAVSAANTRPCEAFHYHVQMYRPDTRGFVELFGINQFASQSACERARDAHFKRNMAVVEVYRARKDEQYQPDRFGSCHCDMTVERSSPNYLIDAQRAAQVRLTEEIRQRVRERLLDLDVPSDADVVRGLILAPPASALLGGPKLVPLPQRTAAEISRPVDDLKMPKVDTAQSAASVDLPLVEITLPGLTAAPTAEAASTPAPIASPPAPPPPTPAPSAQVADPPPQPAPAPSVETTVVEDDAAEAFISYETQRIQNVLKASAAITDEAARSKVLEACMQRIQLLSSLRSLIQGSGARSRLASAARAAKNEPERLALVSKLFGSDMPKHWAPRDATDVILDTRDSDVDPERILRDSTGKFGDGQKRRALYVLLAHSQPAEDQQLWLSTVIETFLQ